MPKSRKTMCRKMLREDYFYSSRSCAEGPDDDRPCAAADPFCSLECVALAFQNV
jgi:hypothetical protein